MDFIKSAGRFILLYICLCLVAVSYAGASEESFDFPLRMAYPHATFISTERLAVEYDHGIIVDVRSKF